MSAVVVKKPFLGKQGEKAKVCEITHRLGLKSVATGLIEL